MRNTGLEGHVEQDIRALLAPVGLALPAAESALRARAALARAAVMPAPRRRGFFARRVFVGAGVGLPLLAVSAVGALTEQSSLGAPIALLASAGGDVAANLQSIATLEDGGESTAASVDANVAARAEAAVQAHADGNGCDDVNPAVVSGTPAPGGPVGCTAGNSGEHRENGVAVTATAGVAAEAAAEAHADGNGCDDVNPAVISGAPAPGGPVGCTVGNSGGHRQNGARASAGAEAGVGVEAGLAVPGAGTGIGVGVGLGAGVEGGVEPHANTLGCDDFNPAVISGAPAPGRPVACTVGNSGDHRKNGAGATAGAEAGAGVEAGLDVPLATAKGKKP